MAADNSEAVADMSAEPEVAGKKEPEDTPEEPDNPAVPDTAEVPEDMSEQAGTEAADKQELAGNRVPAGKSAAESVPAAARRYHR